VKARIEAVQRVFWAIVASSVVVILLGLPVGDDASTMDVLDELEQFRDGFDRAALEKNLLDHARLQGMVTPRDALKHVTAVGVPEIALAPDIAPIEPRAALELASLQQVLALSKPGATTPIAMPDAKAIGVSLGWRLARKGGDGFVLHALSLDEGQASAEAVRREREVADARETLRGTRKAFGEAEARHEKAHELWKNRRKWKASWKSILRANKKRVEAKEAMDSAHDAWTHARERYQKLADAAEAFEAAPGRDRERGVVRATLSPQSGGERFTLQIPVPLTLHRASIPHLRGADFAVTQKSDLWEALAPLDVQQAIEQVKQRFSWHYAHVDVGGFKLGGMTVLQLAPLIFVVLLRVITRRARDVGSSYNPFDRPAGEELPAVGLGGGFLNLLALIGLPLLGCVLCTWSLLQIEHVPVLPVASGLAVLGLGAFAQTALGELMELRDAVTRSHSNPPPEPVG
jgi:hypothetical protein